MQRPSLEEHGRRDLVVIDVGDDNSNADGCLVRVRIGDVHDARQRNRQELDGPLVVLRSVGELLVRLHGCQGGSPVCRCIADAGGRFRPSSWSGSRPSTELLRSCLQVTRR